jgi:hypothetical protein
MSQLEPSRFQDSNTGIAYTPVLTIATSFDPTQGQHRQAVQTGVNTKRSNPVRITVRGDTIPDFS